MGAAAVMLGNYSLRSNYFLSLEKKDLPFRDSKRTVLRKTTSQTPPIVVLEKRAWFRSVVLSGILLCSGISFALDSLALRV